MRDLTRRTLSAELKVRLIRALVKSLSKRNVSLPNGQVFHLKFGMVARIDPETDKILEIGKIQAAFHFGHASRLVTDPPLLQMHVTVDTWRNVLLANVDEINEKLKEVEHEHAGG
jgi:hypothetical protein